VQAIGLFQAGGSSFAEGLLQGCGRCDRRCIGSHTPTYSSIS